VNDAVLEELNEVANRPLPGRTWSVVISFRDRCHFVGRLSCAWAAVQRCVGEDSVAEFGEVPVDLGAKRVEIALREIALCRRPRDHRIKRFVSDRFFGPFLTFLVGRRRDHVTAALDQCHC
jgi:hypothetical protein